ncbi:MAG: ABC transporter permease [Sphaerochaetaceae bacterium]
MINKEKQPLYHKFRNSLIQSVGKMADPIIAIIMALLVGSIIIAITGDDVLLAITSLVLGAFGNMRSLGQSFLAATPILFTGLAFAVAYRSGIFNIGAEGQFLVGAIAGAYVGTLFIGLPSYLYITMVLLAGAIFGALWAFLPAILKIKLGVHEVINVIMLNKIALYFTNWLVSSSGPFRMGSTLPATPFVCPSVRFQPIFPNSPMNVGYFIGMVIAYVIYLIMWKTKGGFQMRAVGHNLYAAKFSGIYAERSMVKAFMLSGALAGIGGAMEICSVFGRFYAGFSPGYGFEGIAVSLLGNNHPAGIIISSILFGALKTGAMRMQILAGTNVNLVKVLQALIIFFVASRWSLVKVISNYKEKKRRLKTSDSSLSKEGGNK